MGRLTKSPVLRLQMAAPISYDGEEADLDAGALRTSTIGREWRLTDIQRRRPWNHMPSHAAIEGRPGEGNLSPHVRRC